jgi:NTP pyrophosphatase (non-canonical NTP hydrolase)
MHLDEAQSSVDRVVRTAGLALEPGSRMLDLASEVGELAKELLVSTGYGTEPFTRTEEWDDELGDVAFALFALAAVTGSSIDHVLSSAITKVNERIVRSGSASSERTRRPV